MLDFSPQQSLNNKILDYITKEKICLNGKLQKAVYSLNQKGFDNNFVLKRLIYFVINTWKFINFNGHSGTQVLNLPHSDLDLYYTD